MKQCSQCKALYTDESLRFCVNDGAFLTAANASEETAMLSRNSEETVFLPRHKNPLRIDIKSPEASAPPAAAPQNFQPPPAAPPAGKGFNPVIIGVLGAALLLLVGGGALAAFILSRASGDVKPDDNKKVAAVSPSPSSSVSTNSSSPSASESAPGDDAAQLRAEMANLQKQLQDQKNQKQTALPNVGSTSKQPTVSSSSLSSPQTARANSPRDGFLALRDEPNSKSGYRIAEIPHGAVITVVDCPRPSNVGKIPGRWCQVVYNGQSGWAFDAFISF